MKIEKGVPIPPKGGNVRYPWAEMEIGDSFEVEGSKTSALVTSSNQWAKRNAPERQFTVRASATGVRVWRIADKVETKNDSRQIKAV